MQDTERRQQAGIPSDQVFATKPVLAQQMLARAFDAGVACPWVTADCVYGDDRTLRRWLEQRPQAYVLAVTGRATLWWQMRSYRVKHLLTKLPNTGWERLSAGSGRKGPRTYDWYRLELSDATPAGWKRWLLVRRSVVDPSDVRAFVAFAPAQTTLPELVWVAGMRWKIEERIQIAKGAVGLDHYEVRSWTGWYRHITLAMWAQAFLAVVRSETGTQEVLKKGHQVPTGGSSLSAFKAHRSLRSG